MLGWLELSRRQEKGAAANNVAWGSLDRYRHMRASTAYFPARLLDATSDSSAASVAMFLGLCPPGSDAVSIEHLCRCRRTERKAVI